MKKVLLISFYVHGDVGLRTLGSIIKKLFRISYLFFLDGGTLNYYTYGKTLLNNSLIEFCASYDYILISSTSFNKDIAYGICDKIKEINKQSKIIIGGSLGIFEYEESIKHSDAVCVWEGHNILDLLKKFERDSNIEIPNFFISKYPKLMSAKDIASLPFPDFDTDNQFFYIGGKVIKNSRYLPKSVIIEATRGCYFNCTFCHISEINKIKKKNNFELVSIKPPSRLIEEMRYISSKIPLLSSIVLSDENFLFYDCDNLMTFTNLYNKYLNQSLYFSADFRSKDFIKKIEILSKSKQRIVIQLGVQGGTEEFNKTVYNRNQSIKDSLSKLRRMQEIFKNNSTNKKIDLYFIVCHPEEEKKDIIETINIISELDKVNFIVLSFSPLPHMGKKVKKLNKYFSPNFDTFKKNPFYYFYIYSIIHLKARKLNFLISREFKDNYLFRTLNSPLFAKLFHKYIEYANSRYQMKITKDVIKEFYEHAKEIHN